MDNPTRPLRGNRRPGALAITVAAALILLLGPVLLLGLGAPGSPAHAGPVDSTPGLESTARQQIGATAHPGQGTPSSISQVTDASGIPPAVIGPPVEGLHNVLVWELTPEDQSRAATPETPSQEPEAGQETTEGTETDSGEGHRFLSPGLLGLTALVAVTALVGAYLSIRSRRRSRKSKETEE